MRRLSNDHTLSTIYQASQGGAYFIRVGERRTRLYLTPQACERARARGELYTDAEYQELTRVSTQQQVKGVRRR